MSTSLVVRMAERFGVEPEKFMETIKSTAFKSDKPVSNEQMMALLVVAEQYGLNPWTREIYAFPDRDGIVPVIGVDGWVRMMNQHKDFDGIEYDESEEHCTAIIYRKDRAHPTTVTEYMSECKRNTGPWKSHPRRLLRHKATIQCARLAFGFVGIYEPDEAERIIEKDVTPPETVSTPRRATIDLDSLSPPAEEETLLEPPTYAQVADMINNSQTWDEGKAALDMTEHLPPDQRAELAHLHVQKWDIPESPPRQD